MSRQVSHRRMAALRLATVPVLTAVAAVAVAVVVSLALHPIVHRTSLVLLLVATALATWRAGWRAGVASTVLALLAADSLIQTHEVIGESPAVDVVLLTLLAAGGLVLTWLVASLQAARTRADALTAEGEDATRRARPARRRRRRT